MSNQVREVPLITVKAISPRIVEQLYASRGDLDGTPYPDLGPEWIAIGKLATTNDVLLRNANNGEVRLCWLWRYAATRQDIKDASKLREFQSALSAKLPTIYVA